MSYCYVDEYRNKIFEKRSYFFTWRPIEKFSSLSVIPRKKFILLALVKTKHLLFFRCEPKKSLFLLPQIILSVTTEEKLVSVFIVTLAGANKIYCDKCSESLTLGIIRFHFESHLSKVMKIGVGIIGGV